MSKKYGCMHGVIRGEQHGGEGKPTTFLTTKTEDIMQTGNRWGLSTNTYKTVTTDSYMKVSTHQKGSLNDIPFDSIVETREFFKLDQTSKGRSLGYKHRVKMVITYYHPLTGKPNYIETEFRYTNGNLISPKEWWVGGHTYHSSFKNI